MNMPRPASDNTFQVAFKIPEEWVRLADEVAAKYSNEGAPLTRTDALRMALLRGLRDLNTGEKAKAKRAAQIDAARRSPRGGS